MEQEHPSITFSAHYQPGARATGRGGPLAGAGKGIAAQLDFTATPRHTKGQLFSWTVYDYPLKQAILDGVVKRPLKGIAKGITEQKSEIASTRYQTYLAAGVERWKEYRDQFAPLDRKPVLFVMMNETAEADEVGDWLQKKYPAEFGGDRLLIIHTDRSGDVSKKDLDKARVVARDVDLDKSPVNRAGGPLSVGGPRPSGCKQNGGGKFFFLDGESGRRHDGVRPPRLSRDVLQGVVAHWCPLAGHSQLARLVLGATRSPAGADAGIGAAGSWPAVTRCLGNTGRQLSRDISRCRQHGTGRAKKRAGRNAARTREANGLPFWTGRVRC